MHTLPLHPSHFLKKIIPALIIMVAISIPLKSQMQPKSVLIEKRIEGIATILRYTKDSMGFWQQYPPQTVKTIAEIDSFSWIGKNNKTRTVYVKTPTSILALTLDKEAYKTYKDNKLLPNLKEKEWHAISTSLTNEMEEEFQSLNRMRQQFVDDSIAEVKRLEKIRAEEAARRERLRQDSIQKAKKIAEEDSLYRLNNPHKLLNLTDFKKNLSYFEEKEYLGCAIPDCDFKIKDETILPVLISNDHLAYMADEDPILEITPLRFHTLKISDKLKNDTEFKRYFRAWGDSLIEKGKEYKVEGENLSEWIETMNGISSGEALAKLQNKAPNGFISDYSWDNDYGPVSLNISYLNTNKKTIKYIKFFFTVYNDVNDVRGSGSIQCTGPVEYLESGSWTADHTNCWPAGDASRLKITKILITYMNGSTVTLSGNKILVN